MPIDTSQSVIKQSNKLIEANYYLSAIEQKIILYLISQVRKNDSEFTDITVNINDLADLLNLGYDRNTVLRKTCEELLKKVLIIRNGDNPKDWYGTHWVQTAEYRATEGVMVFCFDNKLKPYLLQLREAYVSGALNLFLTFKCKYTARLYMMIAQYRGTEEIYYSIEEIVNRFKLGKTYLRISNLKDNVLTPAIEELEKKAGEYLSFDCEYVKDGRSIIGIRFFNIVVADVYEKLQISKGKTEKSAKKSNIETKKNTKKSTKEKNTKITKSNNTSVTENFNDETKKILKMATDKKIGITLKTVNKFIKDFGIERVKNNIVYAFNHKNGMHNMSGWIITCIREDKAADEQETENFNKEMDEKEISSNNASRETVNNMYNVFGFGGK